MTVGRLAFTWHRVFNALYALDVTLATCCLKVIWESIVTPR